MEDLTPEQIQELQQKAAKVEELEKFKNESEAKLKEYETAKTDWEKKEAQYKSEVNPNWARARQVMERQKAALKEKGVETDDDGNVVSNPQRVDVEKIKQEAVAAAQGVVLGSRLEELLGEYDDESSKVVRHYYGKLITGENVTLQNVKKFVDMAENAARSELGGSFKKTATQYSGGQGPRYFEKESGKLDDASAVDLATKMGIKIQGMEQKK